MDDDLNPLFDAEPPLDADEGYAQDGPDLFGAEPTELILPTEPVPVPDPDMEIDLDEMSEIPVDPDEADDDEGDGPDVLAAAPPHETPAAPALTLPPSASGTPVSRPDAPLALYRRYRPDTFAELIGQDHVTEPLQRALVNNRVNHAYLFSGPRGCGKTTSARILARCLNCEQGPTPTPCGQCQSCRDLARGGSGSIDVIEIDAASHGGVNEARDLRERAFFAPVHSRYKIYIIDEAHMVTKEGFNALLKVVEEPPAHVKFIFATTEPEKVLGTIRSRTHHYPFRLVPPRTLTAYLGRLCDEEGVAVDHAVLPLVVRAGAGSVRDSLSVLDQLLGGAAAGGVTYGQAAALLGYTPDTLLDEIVDAFAAGDAAGVFACIDKVLDVGQDPRRFAEDLLRRLRDLIIVAAVPDALSSGLVDVSADQGERLTTQARGLGAGELARAAEVLAQGLTDMRGTTAPRLHLELMCARVLLPGADADDRGTHARLDRIERRLAMFDEQPPPVPSDAAAAPGEAPRPPRRPEPTPERTPEPTSEPARASGRPAAVAPASDDEAWPSPAVPAGASPEAERAPRVEPAAQRPAPTLAGPAGRAGDPASIGTAEVRHVWPQVLEAVKNRRRVTWIILRENAQVHAYADGVLTVAVNNPGARESLGRGGSDDVLREAVLEVLGVAPRVEIVVSEGHLGVDPGAAAGAGAPGRGVRPATNPDAPDPGVRASPQAQGDASPAAAGGVRAANPWPANPAPANPSAANPGSAPEAPAPAELARRRLREAQAEPFGVPEEEPDRDDPDVDPADVAPDHLLATYLGAELIGEEEPPGR